MTVLYSFLVPERSEFHEKWPFFAIIVLYSFLVPMLHENWILGSAKTNLLSFLWPAEWMKPAPFRSIAPFYDTFLAAICEMRKSEKISKTANENIWNFRILHQLIMYDPSTYTNVLRNFVSFHSLLLLHLIQAQLDPLSFIWNIWMQKMMDKVEISFWNIWMWENERQSSEILNDIASIALAA